MIDNASPVHTYANACAAYTQAVVNANTARNDAEKQYRAEVTAIRTTAEQAVQRREAAYKRTIAADNIVAAVDDTAADLWRRTSTETGHNSIGPTPAPNEETETETAKEIKKRLHRVAKRLEDSRRNRLPFEAPIGAVPVSAVIGAITCTLAVWGASALLAIPDAGNGWRPIFQAAALVVLFLGVFAGVPVVAGWLAARHRVGPQAIHISASVIGALAVTAILAPFLL